MKGIIVKINPKRGMVAVQTDEGFSIFELLSAETTAVGDEVEWPDASPLGTAHLHNHTQNESYDVYFQNHQVPSSQVSSQLKLE